MSFLVGLTDSFEVGWNRQERFHGKAKHTLAGVWDVYNRLREEEEAERPE